MRDAHGVGTRQVACAHTALDIICEMSERLGLGFGLVLALTGILALTGWTSLGNLIDRSLAEVRMTAGLEVQHHLFSLADFIAEIKLSATLEAQVKGS